jgi:hypothetical protein
MNDSILAIAMVLVIGAVALTAGVGLGIVLLAPRIRRALDRAETDDGGREETGGHSS